MENCQLNLRFTPLGNRQFTWTLTASILNGQLPLHPVFDQYPRKNAFPHSAKAFFTDSSYDFPEVIYLKKADSTILLKPTTGRRSIPFSIVSSGTPSPPSIVSNSLHILETSCAYSINGYVLIQMYGTIWQEPVGFLPYLKQPLFIVFPVQNHLPQPALLLQV